jgi:hypothetical protein
MLAFCAFPFGLVAKLNYPTCAFLLGAGCTAAGSVHNSSASKILSAKAWLQGEKHSKVGHLASIFNAAGAFFSQNIAA